MGTSAFEVLIAPIFLGTLGAFLACAAVFSLLYAAGALAARIHNGIQSLDDVHDDEWPAIATPTWALEVTSPAHDLGRTMVAGWSVSSIPQELARHKT